MVLYNCPRCDYKTDRRSCINKHFDRKILCTPTIGDISIDNCKKMLKIGEIKIETQRTVEKIDHICKYCNKNFDRKQRLDSHLNKCSEKDSILEKMQTQIKIQQEELKIQQEEMKKLKEGHELKESQKIEVSTNNGTVNNNCNTNTNTNNISNYITINSYKNTDYKAVEKALLACIKVGGEINMRKLIEIIHFNENAPQNHNIYIANSKTKRVMKYDGDKFVEEGTGNNGIEKVFNEKLSDIDEHQELDDELKIASEATWMQFNDKDTQQRREVLEGMYTPLYNKRNMIENDLKK
jgi:hypothetical protein